MAPQRKFDFDFRFRYGCEHAAELLVLLCDWGCVVMALKTFHMGASPALAEVYAVLNRNCKMQGFISKRVSQTLRFVCSGQRKYGFVVFNLFIDEADILTSQVRCRW